MLDMNKIGIVRCNVTSWRVHSAFAILLNYVPLINIRILSVAQQCFYGRFLSPAGM